MKCPFCLHDNSDAAAAFEDVLKQKSHRGITCCTRCAKVLVYHQGELRGLTEQESAALKSTPIYPLIELVQAAVRIRQARVAGESMAN